MGDKAVVVVMGGGVTWQHGTDTFKALREIVTIYKP
jgi:hypothetical protein